MSSGLTMTYHKLYPKDTKETIQLILQIIQLHGPITQYQLVDLFDSKIKSKIYEICIILSALNVIHIYGTYRKVVYWCSEKEKEYIPIQNLSILIKN